MNIITFIRCLIGSMGQHEVLLIRFSKAVYAVPLVVLKARYKQYLKDLEYKADRIDIMVEETFARDIRLIREWVRIELSWKELEKAAQKVREYGKECTNDDLHREFPCAYFKVRI